MSERYAGYSRLKFDYPVERVLRITISNPDRLNALDAVGHRELAYVWGEVDADPDISAVLLTGEGKAFSAGGDFDMIENIMDDPKVRLGMWKEAKDLVYNILNCGKPIVSAINGPAVGAGLVAALCADVPIAARHAKLVDGHTRLGVAAGDHGVILWPLLCGMAKAKYYLLTCDPLTGEEAERIGLVAKTVDGEQVMDEALDVAKRLAAGPPTAIRFTKYALNNVLRMLGPSFDTSTALEMIGFSGPEPREGVAAHREKREPRWDQDCPI